MKTERKVWAKKKYGLNWKIIYDGKGTTTAVLDVDKGSIPDNNLWRGLVMLKFYHNKIVSGTVRVFGYVRYNDDDVFSFKTGADKAIDKAMRRFRGEYTAFLEDEKNLFNFVA